MKRILTYCLIPLVLGIAASWLRAYELCYMYDAVTGLHAGSSTVSVILTALVCVASLAYIALGIFARTDAVGSKISVKVLPAVSCICFLILFAYGGFEIYSYMQSSEITTIIFGVLSLACAASILLISFKGLEMNDSMIYNICAALPVFWACYSLILIFRERISDPIISHYIYMLLAFVCILLFAYALCAHIFGKNRIKIAAITAPLGLFFCVIELLAPVLGDIMCPGTVFIRANVQEVATLLSFALYMPVALPAILNGSSTSEE